ncbi:MAG: DUF4238 domain-containing protein [Candidatus Eisenbacteria bacterium]|nr:DUF4238 domain-containing protein [Candidatus Eisenbacteria bacterium]
MNNINSHFVSRFITRDWEHGDRRLTYYDARQKRILTKSSKRLFAEDNDQECNCECRLNELIETPVSQGLPWLCQHESSKEPLVVDDWKLYRGLVLFLLVQAVRVKPETQGELRTLLERSDDEIDSIIKIVSKRFILYKLEVTGGNRFFYTNTGIFGFVVPDKKKPVGFGLGMPISSKTMIAFLELSFDSEGLERRCKEGNGGYLTSLDFHASN